MDFLEKISRDLTEAMKSHGEDRELVISVVRMIKSAVKNAEIALRGGGKTLSDEDIVGVLSTMVKQRRESAEQYLNANRKDLADKENREVEIIQRYLPAQLTQEELDAVIRSAIEETGIASAKETGRLMKVLMPQVKGKADGRLVNLRVKEILESMA
jgi:uncharacterized protein YqeY